MSEHLFRRVGRHVEVWELSITPVPEGITPHPAAEGGKPPACHYLAATRERLVPVPGRRTWTDAEKRAWDRTEAQDSARLLARIPLRVLMHIANHERHAIELEKRKRGRYARKKRAESAQDETSPLGGTWT